MSGPPRPRAPGCRHCISCATKFSSWIDARYQRCGAGWGQVRERVPIWAHGTSGSSGSASGPPCSRWYPCLPLAAAAPTPAASLWSPVVGLDLGAHRSPSLAEPCILPTCRYREGPLEAGSALCEFWPAGLTSPTGELVQCSHPGALAPLLPGRCEQVRLCHSKHEH